MLNDDWLAGWLAGWLDGCQAGWLAGGMPGLLAGWQSGKLTGWLAGSLFYFFLVRVIDNDIVVSVLVPQKPKQRRFPLLPRPFSTSKSLREIFLSDSPFLLKSF